MEASRLAAQRKKPLPKPVIYASQVVAATPWLFVVLGVGFVFGGAAWAWLLVMAGVAIGVALTFESLHALMKADAYRRVARDGEVTRGRRLRWLAQLLGIQLATAAVVLLFGGWLIGAL
ncbi:MAG: hypothetical protein AAGB29_07075 [Planctomycetota bacterium]